MSRFSRLFASGFPLRFASATVAAAMFASLLMLPNFARAQGLFQSPNPSLTTGSAPQGIAAADLDRNGFTDLVVTDSTSKNVKIFLATGPNTYAPPNTLPTCGTGNGNNETGPSAVIAKDFNNDGYPDIVVACTKNNSVELFLNNGAGGFGAPAVTQTVTNPVALAAGSFTGNANLMDLAVASSSGGVTVILDLGTSESSIAVPLTGTLTGIVTGDFNHDGNLDLAVSDSANNEVHVLTGNGSGNFTALGAYSTGTGTKPSGIVAADFNQDGNLDVATSNAGKNTATVLLGSRTGALTAQAAQATGTDPIAIVTTDVNSDGLPDVVTFDALTATTGEVDVLLGNGDGTLQVAQATRQAFEPGTLAAVADFNRDGKPDIALTQQNNNQASVLLNNTLPTGYPDGRSSAPYNPLTVGMGNFADSVAVGDFNKDGNLDVAVSYLQDNDVQVLLGAGNGSFSAGSTYAVGNQPYRIASGDLNGDGYPDLVATNTNVNGATGTVTVLLNNKNGTFTASPAYTVGKQPYETAIGDLNGDGHPDLAVTNYGANTVTILFGSANGTFTVQPTTLATCADPYGVAIGDFKHNGFPSVAVTCYSTSQLEIFPNNGNGTFGSPFMYTIYDSYTSLTPNPGPLVVGDFNRDGKLDIVVGNTNANNISFFAGNGDNTFVDSQESAPSLNHPSSIAAGDFNGDGILDIVGVAPNYNAVDVTLGAGDGTFGTIAQRAAGQYTAKTQPWGLAVGDFNNDGQLDIVTANTFHQVAIDSPTNQARYMGEFPATPGGNPSVDVLLNASAAQIILTTTPGSPLPYNNSGVTINANVQPAYSGGTPTGSVIFENSSGAVLGTGPYALNAGGTASYAVGHLGSGTYLFTSLYSGDANFQPTTGSGTAFAVTVNGTPVTLTLSASSVTYGTTGITGTVTVTGTGVGGYPSGSATVYTSTGATVGTINTLTHTGNNATGTVTFNATAPNFNVGSYELYAVYNSTNGNFPNGSSSDVPFTVTAEQTSTSVSCAVGSALTCTSTTTAVTTNTRVPAGLTVNFSATLNALFGGSTTVTGTGTTNGTGQATFTVPNPPVIGSYSVTATFPAQTNYLGSSGSTSGICILGCFSRSNPVTPFDSFTEAGFDNGFGSLNANRNNGANQRSLPFTLF